MPLLLILITIYLLIFISFHISDTPIAAYCASFFDATFSLMLLPPLRHFHFIDWAFIYFLRSLLMMPLFSFDIDYAICLLRHFAATLLFSAFIISPPPLSLRPLLMALFSFIFRRADGFRYFRLMPYAPFTLPLPIDCWYCYAYMLIAWYYYIIYLLILLAWYIYYIISLFNSYLYAITYFAGAAYCRFRLITIYAMLTLSMLTPWRCYYLSFYCLPGSAARLAYHWLPIATPREYFRCWFLYAYFHYYVDCLRRRHSRRSLILPPFWRWSHFVMPPLRFRRTHAAAIITAPRRYFRCF